MQQEFDIGKDNKTDMLYKVYRAVGGAADRQVAEMLDDGLAVRLRRRALAKRSAAGLVCTAAAVAIIMTAAYKLPLGSDIEKTDKSVYSSPTENVGSEETAEQVKSADEAEFGDEEKAEQNAQENGGTYSNEQEQTDQSAKPDTSTETDTDTKKNTAADDADPAGESSRMSSDSGKPTSSKGSASSTSGSDSNEPTGGGPPLGWNADLSKMPYGIMTRDQWHMIVEGYYTVEMNAIKALPLEMTH